MKTADEYLDELGTVPDWLKREHPILYGEVLKAMEEYARSRRTFAVDMITIDDAEELAMTTDYAVFADESTSQINKADAGAFFFEGFRYALNCVMIGMNAEITLKNTK